MNEALRCTVDVIIPVYRGFDETVACVEAAKQGLSLSNANIILVDDCSPEPEISAYLKEQSVLDRIHLIVNEENLGFVASVNKAMAFSRDDVVLLNSDAIVSNDWLQRLQAAAYKSGTTATATPLSNNATICSVPSIASLYEDGILSLAEVDRLAADVNSGMTVDIPTAVGFCMYIKRSALEHVGYFDEEHFGRGYGEENDFCMRCMASGLKHVMAMDVFVHHEGEVSFSSESEERKQKAEQILLSLHPTYTDLLKDYLAKNEAERYQLKLLTEAQWQSLYKNLSAEKSVLHILGLDGGGSFKYVQSLVEESRERVKHFALLIDEQHCYLQDLNSFVFYNLSAFSAKENLADLLFEKLAFNNVHLHRFSPRILDVFSPVDFSRIGLYITYHDISFLKSDIFSDINNIDFKQIEDHRSQEWIDACEPFRQSAKLIFFPSEYLKTLYARVFADADNGYVFCPDRALTPKPLNAEEAEEIERLLDQAFDTEKKTIAVVGALGKHKGFDYFEALRELTTGENGGFNWLHIGYSDKISGQSVQPNYIVTGAYEAESLPALLSHYQVDIVYFPLGVPESYCYALSDVLASPLPVLVHGLGALEERVEKLYGRAHILPAEASCDEVADYLLNFVPSERKNAPKNHNSKVLDVYIEELQMSSPNAPSPEDFHALQEHMQQYSVDQLPYRTELRRLSEVESYLEGQLMIAQKEIDSLDRLAEERKHWAESIEKNHKQWQEKLEGDLASQEKMIGELVETKAILDRREVELQNEIAAKTEALEITAAELHRAQFSLKHILTNLKSYLIRYIKERLKL
ncbi:glycosyltransferase [Pseudoteredinibacter isoporae]|uniref:GT2 family glycosyltransferase n=1 Tax=Pseudoteredinibacter isoporae TaxID=570281 RepID=A0A7X0JRL1_9GAMM|nr:glycosyltransferase [Pseudoteredinibacter isoporae]MBB6520105.1 GT2 family glycosyltransferase [Pseudoteredinibacter isoporae]NHO85677.1 glycosyltransferase [Pseudoteredinibacter isoporae]NIB25871.1 glycosyltransferase [Pseudoteredinibacter isoporae]